MSGRGCGLPILARRHPREPGLGLQGDVRLPRRRLLLAGRGETLHGPADFRLSAFGFRLSALGSRPPRFGCLSLCCGSASLRKPRNARLSPRRGSDLEIASSCCGGRTLMLTASIAHTLTRLFSELLDGPPEPNGAFMLHPGGGGLLRSLDGLA